jgi:hypothetical protein
MFNYWLKMWSDLFENSFNYYYRYTYKMFNPDIRIGTDDDVVVMGDVTVVLPYTKRMEGTQRKVIKDAVIDALKEKYKKDESIFKMDPKRLQWQR